MRRLAAVLASMAAGCGFDGAAAGGDAMPAPDGPDTPQWTTADCPDDYVTVAGLTSRYRVEVAPDTFWAHLDRCSADDPARTHLASLDAVTEIVALQELLAMYQVPTLPGFPAGYEVVFVGAVQQRGQSMDAAGMRTGWVTFAGDPLVTDQWAPPQPDDGNDGVENQSEDFGVLFKDPVFPYLGDLEPVDYPVGALCECDGVAIAPGVQAELDARRGGG